MQTAGQHSPDAMLNAAFFGKCITRSSVIFCLLDFNPLNFTRLCHNGERDDKSRANTKLACDGDGTAV